MSERSETGMAFGNNTYMGKCDGLLSWVSSVQQWGSATITGNDWIRQRPIPQTTLLSIPPQEGSGG
jgi:hypothetical protein